MDRVNPATAGVLQLGYQFGEFRLETDGTLWRRDSLVPLDTAERAILRLLLARRGRIITPQELHEAVSSEGAGEAVSIAKCIASLRRHLEPDDCIQTISKRGYRFTAALRPLGATPGTGLPRLAILPFEGGYAVPEFLGPAIAEEASAQLDSAQPSAVSIACRDSVNALARRKLTPHQIGQLLNVDYVLTGEVQLLALHYRLRVQMIRVEDGLQIWSEERLVESAHWVLLESELIRLISLRMEGTGLSIAASAASAGEREWLPEQREAHEIFARARYEWQSLERHRMQDALHHLLRAIELDPGALAARLNLVNLCVTQAFYGFMPPAIAADIVHRETEAIPDLALRGEFMLPALGWTQFHFERNLPAALDSFARSAHLPYDPWTVRARTLFALSRHRFTEAIDLLQAGIRVDPWSPWLQARLAWAHHLSGDGAGALQLAHTAMDRFPDDEGAQLYGASILAFHGESERAIAVSQSLTRRLPYLDPAAAVHAYTLAIAGRTDEARTILERLLWLSRERYTMVTFASAVFVALGEFDQALEVLRVADEQRCPWFFQMLADPRLQPLRQRREFQSLLAILAGMEAEADRERREE